MFVFYTSIFFSRRSFVKPNTLRTLIIYPQTGGDRRIMVVSRWNFPEPYFRLCVILMIPLIAVTFLCSPPLYSASNDWSPFPSPLRTMWSPKVLLPLPRQVFNNNCYHRKLKICSLLQRALLTKLHRRDYRPLFEYTVKRLIFPDSSK